MLRKIECNLCNKNDSNDLVQINELKICCECIKTINGVFARRNQLDKFVYLKNRL